jgi:hypothetical protein
MNAYILKEFGGVAKLLLGGISNSRNSLASFTHCGVNTKPPISKFKNFSPHILKNNFSLPTLAHLEFYPFHTSPHRHPQKEPILPTLYPDILNFF